MTQPTEPPQAQPPVQPPTQPAGAPIAAESPIDAYVRANHLRYSEAAIRQALLAAGNQPDAVDAALARFRGDPGTVGAGRRWAKVLLWIYIGGFALLSIAMFANAGGPVASTTARSVSRSWSGRSWSRPGTDSR